MNEREYILQASVLENGESLFINTKTKKEQQKLHSSLMILAKSFIKEVDPTISLTICKTFQDTKLWIKIIKDKAPTEVYVKTLSGEVRKVKI